MTDDQEEPVARDERHSRRRLTDRRDSDQRNEPYLTSKLERHVQSALSILMAGLLAWGANKVATSVEISARQEQQLISLTAEVTRMRSRVETSVPLADVQRQFDVRDTQIVRLDERIRALERVVASLEARMLAYVRPPPVVVETLPAVVPGEPPTATPQRR